MRGAERPVAPGKGAPSPPRSQAIIDNQLQADATSTRTLYRAEITGALNARQQPHLLRC
jgi:hypothetical protein